MGCDYDFYNNTKDKYLKIYPNAKKLLNYFENNNIETFNINTNANNDNSLLDDFINNTRKFMM